MRLHRTGFTSATPTKATPDARRKAGMYPNSARRPQPTSPIRMGVLGSDISVRASTTGWHRHFRSQRLTFRTLGSCGSVLVFPPKLLLVSLRAHGSQD